MEIGSPEWFGLIRDGAATLGVCLTQKHAQCFARHARLLLEWNRVTNLTSITRPREIALNHFLDSLAAAGMVPAGAHLLDVGSGGGFPGLPLHVVVPGLSTTLVDASRKKVSFLRQVIRQLGLEGIRAVHARVEDLAGRGRPPQLYDVVVSRAFSALAGFAGVALPLLKPKGRLIAFKGEISEAEVAALASSADTDAGLGWAVEERGYVIPGLKRRRSLVVVRRAPVTPQSG
jgi:16S rRNA (guanine527-N7)-methyltransferase